MGRERFQAVMLALLAAMAINADESLQVTKGSDGLFKITKKNFYRAAQDYENMIVYFVKPDCSDCQFHRDDVQGLAKGLENKVAVGLIDVEADPDVGKVFQINTVPAMRFFRKGKPFKYGGNFFAEDMAGWAQKMLSLPYKEMETEMEVYAVMENVGISYLFFHNESNTAEAYHLHEFQDLARTWQWAHDVKFALVQKPDLIEYFRDVDAWIKATPALMIYTKWELKAQPEKKQVDFKKYYDPLNEDLKKMYDHKDRARGHEEVYRAKASKTEL
jgi:thiol-disulfide isomerase/thioredoxin